MYSLFLVGVAVLVGGILFARWYTSTDTKSALKALKWIGIVLFVLIAGFFVATGRLGWAFMGLPVLLPWLMRARAVARAAKAFSRMSQAHAGTASGETSDVETPYFRMTLDHDSGDMHGTVRKGPHQGKELAQLTTSQLLDLLAECRASDLDSARVLEAFLDRHRSEWREGDAGQAREAESEAPRSHNTTMGRQEALQVLGLSEDATDADIKQAHRKLISGMHPDHGGSDYLAAQINQAKDILLGD